MKEASILFVALCLAGLLAGCRSPDYHAPGDRPHVAAVRGQKVVRDKFDFSLRLAPGTAPANIKAVFRCDVARPPDKTLSGFIDECLIEAYHHMRGEERKGIAAKGILGLRDAFFADYREWFDDEWDSLKSGELPAHVGQWACDVEGRIVHCDKRHFSYRVTIDTETGGAHPNRWVQNATFSREDGRRLAVADLVRRECMTDVVNLIRRAVRREAHDDTLRDQLKAEIRQPYDDYVREIRARKRDEWGNPLVTENFLLTRGGIVWVYNQYEIACYAAGVFEVCVSWRDVRPYLHEKRKGKLPLHDGDD